jgi:hypothetical protein
MAGQGQHHGELVAHALDRLELAAPRHGVSRGHLELRAEQGIRFLHVARGVPLGQVDIDVAGEQAVLVAEHARTGDALDLGEAAEGDLQPSVAGGHEHAPHRLGVRPEVGQVAHADRVTFAALDRLGGELPPDRRRHHLLRLGDGEAVLGQLVAPPADVEEIASERALGEDPAGPLDRPQDGLGLGRDPLDHGRVGPRDLEAERGSDARAQHVDPGLDGHGPRVGEARQAQGVVQLLNQGLARDVVRGDPAHHGQEPVGRPRGIPGVDLAPLRGRLQLDDRLEHR